MTGNRLYPPDFFRIIKTSQPFRMKKPISERLFSLPRPAILTSGENPGEEVDTLI